MVQPPPLVPPPLPPPPLPWDEARKRQAPVVMTDPKYMLDTGIGIGCPRCGSRNLLILQKTGSGLWFIGSFAWVITMGLLDSMYAHLKSQPFKCNYCEAQFTL